MPIFTKILFLRTRITALLAFTIFLGINGCLFDSKLPVSTHYSSQEEYTDALNPKNGIPTKTIDLFEPIFDETLGSGRSTKIEFNTPVTILEKETGEIIQYRYSSQRFGSWNSKLEFLWNYFSIQSNFIFREDIPDTAGMENSTDSLYLQIQKTDAFTHYFDSAATPEIIKLISTSTKAGAIGIGIKQNLGSDTIRIKFVVANSPASRAGLENDMAILLVNDSSVLGDSALERFQRFSVGDSGESVKLTLDGPEGITEVTLIKEPVAFPTIQVDTLSGLVGYIAINGFTPTTVGDKNTHIEFREALVATRNLPVTILDFRDNRGGSVDMAFKMCDEILTDGKIIIRENQRQFNDRLKVPRGSQIITKASAGGKGERAPNGNPRKFLILGNHYSASASEIMILALMEGTNIPFMGTKTYGKGVGQTVKETPGEALALITILKFTGASGREYHNVGIEPDYPDVTEGDLLLSNAIIKAESLANGSLAKVSQGASKGISKRVHQKASTAEWNRKQYSQNKNDIFPEFAP